MQSATKMIIAMAVVVALVVAFWQLELGPKRSEASELSDTVAGLRASLATERGELAAAIAARREFPRGYQQLVVLGQGVPSDSETASLLVELSGLAARAGVDFQELGLEVGGAGAAATPPADASTTEPADGETAAPSSSGPAPVAPTEAAAASLPLGATVGSAGLAVMPYTVTLSGNFFQLAKFLHEIDALVRTKKSGIAVDGRLLTVNGFSLAAGPEGFPDLNATLSVTTYVAPASQTPSAPAAPVEAGATTTATPAAATVGEAP